MKKRLSKSEQKKLLKKKRLRNQRHRQVNPSEDGFSEISLTVTARQKNVVLSYLFVAVLFFTSQLPQPANQQPTTALSQISKTQAVKASSTATTRLKPLPRISPAFANAESNSQQPDLVKEKIASIIKDAPMQQMVEEIAAQDTAVAAFLVGIAMKESKFGRYAPKKNGVDCYNYWGYRGKENPTASGYSCFDSPAHAISVVGGRIESMVKRGAKTPAQMISWKCGSTCAGHSPESVSKWISDVGIHYYQINTASELAKTVKE